MVALEETAFGPQLNLLNILMRVFMPPKHHLLIQARVPITSDTAGTMVVRIHVYLLSKLVQAGTEVAWNMVCLSLGRTSYLLTMKQIC